MYVSQCSNQTCNGIMEFVGTSETVSIDHIQRVQRFQEEAMNQADQKLFLLYKCSCCNRIDVRANARLEKSLNSKAIF